jgi:hypothetical protein
MMATLSVLCPVIKPIGVQTVGEFLRMWDKVRRFCGCEGTEDYSVQTRWLVNREAHWLMLSLSGVRLGS